MRWPIREADGSLTWPAADPTSPFFCHGPTLISFSGGRTSAYMLWRVLCAHGGVLPADVFVVFANTGKEREETLRFVYNCGEYWGVKIWWIERTKGDIAKAPVSERYCIVGLNSASRNGEPFDDLIAKKGFLPNAVTRFCTTELKIRPMKHFMQDRGFTSWINMIGLRADERKRVMRAVMNNHANREQWSSYTPLAMAGVTKRVIMLFWLGRNKDPRHPNFLLPQGFDLGLRDYEGNCDDCMLKGLQILMHQERERPGTADWWIAKEHFVTTKGGKVKGGGARFVTEYSYADMQRWAEASPALDDFDSLPAVPDCTSACAVDDSAEPEPDDGAMQFLFEHMRKSLAANMVMPDPVVKVAAAMSDLFE